MLKDYNTYIKEKNRPDELFLEFFEYFFESNIISKTERFILESNINRFYIVKENFFDKLKTRYDKAKEVVKDFSDKAKESLEKIVKAAKDAAEFVNKMVENLKNTISNILKSSRGKMIEFLKRSDELIKKIKEIETSNKEGLIKDLKIAKEVSTFYYAKFTDSIINKIKEAFKSFIKDDDVTIEEKMSMIYESSEPKNMIAKLVHNLESIPPFSWLDNIEKAGEKGANVIFSGLSQLTDKLGGPKFSLPVIAAIFGFALEQKVKNFFKSGIIDFVSFYTIPFVATLVKVVSWIALLLAIFVVVDAILGTNLFQDDHGQDLSELKPAQSPPER